jgi:acylphosphatase
MFVLDRARVLGLTGWVANEGRGTVRIVAEGPPAALAELRRAVADGPPGARVDHVAEGWRAPAATFNGFSIRSGGHDGD